MTARKSEHPLDACTGFDWDEWNICKNWEKHQVTPEEAESIFFHDPLMLRSDVRHSAREKRFYAIGDTAADRRLLVVFTIRGKLIRVISARDVNHKESEAYSTYEKNS